MAPTDIHPKVQAALIAGAVGTVAFYFLSLAGIDLPADVASAVTTIIAFLAGYLKSS